MNDRTPRSWDIYGYCFTLGLSLAMLVVVIVIISSRCLRIFRTGDDCGVGIGWVGIVVVCVGFAVYSGYRLYGLWWGKER